MLRFTCLALSVTKILAIPQDMTRVVTTLDNTPMDLQDLLKDGNCTTLDDYCREYCKGYDNYKNENSGKSILAECEEIAYNTNLLAINAFVESLRKICAK